MKEEIAVRVNVRSPILIPSVLNEGVQDVL